MTTMVARAWTQPPVNVNVGVLGHVDSGKTNLVRVLSTQLSTAALDKHPQSQQRGITLDLGFSAFRLPVAHGPDGSSGPHELQVTLVDCPGHASLFKTILGGARIIDMVLLVVDATKGLQPQTIESLLIAELAVAHHIVIALNKVDLIPLRGRKARVQRVAEDIRTFIARHFPRLRDHAIPIVPVAAAPVTSSDAATAPDDTTTHTPEALGIADLVATLAQHVHVPERDVRGPFSFAIDHCFAIPGSGTILTGTVLSGALAVGDDLELPSLHVVKPVKSMQMFRTSVSRAAQGDRVGIRVNGLDAALVERGVAVSPPRSLAFVSQLVVPVTPITLFQGPPCATGGKFHTTVGHTTVVARATFFQRMASSTSSSVFDPRELFEHVTALAPVATDASAAPVAPTFALLTLEQPVLCQPSALVVCSRLDLDPKKYACRLAFHGRVATAVVATADASAVSDGSAALELSPAVPTISLAQIQIGKVKTRDGVVDKVVRRTTGDATEVIGRDLFPRDVDWRVFADVRVLFPASKVLGRVLGPFGKAGKFRIALLLASEQRAQVPVAGDAIILRFVKLVQLQAPATALKSAPQRVKAAKNVLQDDALLYPEAFASALSAEPTEAHDSSAPSSSAAAAAPVDSANTHVSIPMPETDREAPRGTIERLKGETTADGRNPLAIVSGLFASDVEALAAVGQSVQVVTQAADDCDVGVIEKPFGKAGKVRVVFTARGGTRAREGDAVTLFRT